MEGAEFGAVTTRVWQAGREVARDVSLTEIKQWLATEDALVWVDLLRPSEDAITTLAGHLGFNQLAVEDTFAEGERPKVRRHEHHVFLQVYQVDLAGPDTQRVRTSKISAYVFKRGLVTVREHDTLDEAELERRWTDDDELLSEGPMALVYGLVDQVVDEYFEVIQQLDDTVEMLEDDLFADPPRAQHLQRKIFTLRKELVALRRAILPVREVVATLARHTGSEVNVPGRLDGYFDDLYDHVMRVTEWTEGLRDMVSSIFETNLSLADARLNTVMKKLAGWAAIIAVPTFITGWFGQNVPFPGFSNHLGLLLTTVLVIVSVAILYWLFKRNDWI